MRDREPTIRSQELGEGLRRAMERAGLNGKQAAHVLGWSPSWVSRLLSGKHGGSEVDIAAFLGVCRVKAPERDRLLALCQELNTPGWPQHEVVPSQALRLGTPKLDVAPTTEITAAHDRNTRSPPPTDVQHPGPGGASLDQPARSPATGSPNAYPGNMAGLAPPAN